MKTSMKKPILLLILISIVAGISSCRKGPEDPLISFVTRKGRLSKKWEAYSYKINGVEIHNALRISKTFRDGCDTQTITRFDSSLVIMDFKKSGEYFGSAYGYFKETSSTPSNPDGACDAYNYLKVGDSTKTTIGFWNFTGGVGDIGNREQVFVYEQEKATGILWDIVRLATDELKLKRKYIKEGESVFTTEEIYFYPAE